MGNPKTARPNGSAGAEQSTTKGRATSEGTGHRGARCVALVGPYLSGKTTLLEALLARTGTVARPGTVHEHTTIGDGSAESKAHAMSVDMTVVDTTYLGDAFTFLDLPGSVEFQCESLAALPAVDAAVVVCEPDPRRLPALQIILKTLHEQGVPHFLFLNKIDSFNMPVRQIIPMLQPLSLRPLVLRQIPIWTDGVATGFVDLALERAFVYRRHAPSEVVAVPEALKQRESEARFQMLERIADYDDTLLEQLLADEVPPRELVMSDLKREMTAGQICPVLLGSGLNGNGIVRLLKALRHETPFVEETCRRLGIVTRTAAAQVIKTLHTAHAGKVSVARVLAGTISEGTVLSNGRAEARVAGVISFVGEAMRKRGTAVAGETVGLGRLDGIGTGMTVTDSKGGIAQAVTLELPSPVFGQAIELRDRKDEVKLSAALAKMMEEDPTIKLMHSTETQQMVLWGQGEMHLRVTLERLKRKYGIEAVPRPRYVSYKETISKGAEIRGRHKKQSGGHGQFGDVVLDIKPLPRGAGFQFTDKIHGGTVPKQFIPSVETGVRDQMANGPLGFPVVDVAVTLLDGSYHSVDSSDMAFRQAGRLAMSEGLPMCQPVLLEPVMAVKIAAPADATAKVNAIISQRRGQILGFDARDGWPGWDTVDAHIPDNEMDDLIVEIRSATAGAGTFLATFHHLAELQGKLADQVLSSHGRATT
jgi:elongation factor G